MKNFINRPIPRLLRYELLLRGIMDESPPGHEDLETIPHVIDVIKALGKDTEPGVTSAKQKVELWRYNSNLVFKNGEVIVSCGDDRPSRCLMCFVRIWISWMSIVHCFTLESCFGSLTAVWNGVDGANSLFYYSTTIVSKVMSYACRCTELRAVVMTKIKERDGVTKYIVNRRVRIPLGYNYSC